MRRLFPAIVMLALAPSVVHAQTDEPSSPPAYDPDDPLPMIELMDRQAEIALARAAAPAAVSDLATIWVLGDDGYEVAQEGTNGWGCLVQRDATGLGTFPRCDDAASVATNFEMYFLFERMRVEGRSQNEYREAVAEGFRTGEYQFPPAGAFSYMYADGPIPPHVMVMRPHCTPEDIGIVNPEDAAGQNMGVSLLSAGTPTCHIVIFTPEETRRPVTGGS